MRLIYLDEAGNTGRRADPDQPIHMIGTLIVEQNQVRPLEVRLNSLATACAAAISARRVGNQGPVRPEEVEFHGSHLFGGSDLFKSLKPAERIAFCHAVVEACTAHEVVFGSCLIDKRTLVTGHPHMLCFQFTLGRVQDYLVSVDDLGLIMADEHRELEEELIRDLASSKEASTGWEWPTVIARVVDTVHFVKSRHNRIIQACDVMTYFRLKGARVRERAHGTFSIARQVTPALSWTEHLQTDTTRSEQAVLKLFDQVKRPEHFSKLWPTT